jgi:hypothetical protein
MGTQRFDERAARGRATEIEDLGVYTLAEIARILEETGDR